MKTTTITIRLPTALHDQLTQRADHERKTVADFVRSLLASGLSSDAEAQRLAQLEQRLTTAVRSEGQQTRALINQLAGPEPAPQPAPPRPSTGRPA